ncbi:hypothetical protein GUJ93_ZPchr0009g1252 [Zizania palustris]|uniref:Uncharacterized protein n=1 Tax=Zizania palustris TaxID=103762 RepID=A0A8J5R3W0_ZIZPA|nr:hypothetical protein GUJ93_ZPchr0009g1252 [Zizania palustris]KAG8050646.1 hypothetical protein GUJ93_ZPchr0009g1252 [Zizania palustris]KAG8050647.1 hypothetical protein GUJ93_ZPchr0009g1252 [Zizania palustris]
MGRPGLRQTRRSFFTQNTNSVFTLCNKYDVRRHRPPPAIAFLSEHLGVAVGEPTRRRDIPDRCDSSIRRPPPPANLMFYV